MTSKEKLVHIRKAMKQHGLDATIIPSADPHMSEYVPNHWRIMAWLTGFSGSTGTVIITKDFAGVWTDSRYFIQAEQQLQGSGFSLMKLRIPHTPEYIEWLRDRLPPSSRVGYDGSLVSVLLARQIEAEFKEKSIRTVPDIDLVSPLWTDRPPFPEMPAYEHPGLFAVRSIREKLKAIRDQMEKAHADYTLLTALDDVSWTFNIRGSDILYNPVVIAWALISLNEASLFIRPEKLPDKLKEKLTNQGIGLQDYNNFQDVLSQLPGKSTLYISPANTNISIYRTIAKDIKIKEGTSFATLLKSIKNERETVNIRHAMIKDGVALTKFFYWLDENLGKFKITELSAAIRLEAFRAEEEYFAGPSFATISSFGPNGAIVHYTPSKESSHELTIPGIYLLDSGGQYFDGTTDITRTIVLGEPTLQQKKDFTLVLKGMIDLVLCRFPAGTRGYQLDVLARNPLWANRLNYGHGTGHGVGYFLNVHEGPQSISTRASAGLGTTLIPGMILSDEPGLYREGEYGIRTENLIQVVRDQETAFGEFLRFETLTLCHIDTKLVESTLFTLEEKEWLNTYHKKVYTTLAPYLNDELKKWLQEKTKRI